MKYRIASLALALAFSLSVVGVGAAPAPKVDVCHFDEEEGVYVLINISENGWLNGHSNHAEDFLFDAELYTEDCVEIPVEEV